MRLNHSKTRTSNASSINFSRTSQQIPLFSVWVTAGNKGFTQGGQLFRCIVTPNLHNLGSSKLIAAFVIRVPDMAFEPLPGDTMAGGGFPIFVPFGCMVQKHLTEGN